MKKLNYAAAGLALALAQTTLAFADNDRPGADWITREQVMQKLTAAGYSDVRKLEADDGHWEGKGIKGGKKMEFHVDPHTGAFTKEKPDD